MKLNKIHHIILNGCILSVFPIQKYYILSVFPRDLHIILSVFPSFNAFNTLFIRANPTSNCQISCRSQ